MYQELSALVIVLSIFTIQLTSADETSIFKDVDEVDKRFSPLEEASSELPYSQQSWFYPHTSQNFLQTLLRYLALNEQSYRNTVKRQRNFGFMASRGKRGEAELLEEYLKRLHDMAERRRYASLDDPALYDSQKDEYIKVKRQPHRGFHGMRG